MKRLGFSLVASLCLLVTFSQAGIEVYATNRDVAGTDLRWNRLVPTSGGPTWPAVVVAPAGEFKRLDPPPDAVAQSMTANGFLTFIIEYRNAPPHTKMSAAGPPGEGQQDPPSDGRPNQQTDDVLLAISTARADPQCNGKVAVIGGSAGASHAVWAAKLGTNNDSKPDAVVALSGLYDLDNSDVLANNTLKSDAQNYINHLLTEGAPFHTAAQAASAFWQSPSGTPAQCLLFNSDGEIMPVSMFSAEVTDLTGTVESHLRASSNVHSFQYWGLGYGGAFSTVQDCAIDFLQRMLSIPQTPPVAPAQLLLH